MKIHLVLRKRSRIRISLLKVESNQTLSLFLIITSLVGMHILAIFKNIDVKSETAPWISHAPVIKLTQSIDSDTIHIDREFSDHDGTYLTLGCGFSNNKNYKRKIWDYKRADYLLVQITLTYNIAILVKSSF
jgi:hypothetical protein